MAAGVVVAAWYVCVCELCIEGIWEVEAVCQGWKKCTLTLIRVLIKGLLSVNRLA